MPINFTHYSKTMPGFTSPSNCVGEYRDNRDGTLEINLQANDGKKDLSFASASRLRVTIEKNTCRELSFVYPWKDDTDKRRKTHNLHRAKGEGYLQDARGWTDSHADNGVARHPAY